MVFKSFWCSSWVRWWMWILIPWQAIPDTLWPKDERSRNKKQDDWRWKDSESHNISCIINRHCTEVGTHVCICLSAYHPSLRIYAYTCVHRSTQPFHPYDGVTVKVEAQPDLYAESSGDRSSEDSSLLKGGLKVVLLSLMGQVQNLRGSACSQRPDFPQTGEILIRSTMSEPGCSVTWGPECSKVRNKYDIEQPGVGNQVAFSVLSLSLTLSHCFSLWDWFSGNRSSEIMDKVV